MKQYKLEILDMIYFCESKINDINVLKQNLNNYFCMRIINRKLCTEQELQNVHIMIYYIEKTFYNDHSAIDKILSKIQTLVLISKDKIYNKNDYEVMIELSNKKELNIDELCNYIKISFDSYWINLPFLTEKIKIYLKNGNDAKMILDLLDNYKQLGNKEYQEIIKLIYSKQSLRLLIEELLKEIDKEKISIVKVMSNLKQIEKLSKNKISNEEFELIMKIFEYLKKKNYLQNKIGNKSENVRKVVEIIINKNLKYKIEDKKIKKAIKNGDIIFTNQISERLRACIRINFDELEIINNSRIITIDDSSSPDIDGAFSIQQIDNIYILNVYITDVPTFLKQNRMLAIEAYQRANSYYVRLFDQNRNYNIDMLPPFLSHKFLSLNKNQPTNAINFTFTIGENGEIYSSSIDRKRIKVTEALTPSQAKQIINSKQNYGMLQKDLVTYKKMCQKIAKNSNDIFLKSLSINNMSDLIAFPSVMVNYYVGKKAQFAIYRENGTYVKQFESNPYTHSSTPLRRFVSDINLAFFLNQNGIVSFPEKDLNYIETNIDEIIAHLIEKDHLSDFVNRNSNFVKKYLK